MASPIPELIFDEVSGRGGNLGIITLNRPSALNSLNHTMLLTLDHQLQEWADASHIKAVIIRAVEGRAFCAGGDIKEVALRKQAEDPHLLNFFRDEYRLNARVHNFTKPYIALLNGITMGGGAGISIHGSHRVATQNLVFAMPETGIGFYPDVGSTYFLTRLPYKIGFYLGLTGAKISSSDCFHVGLVDFLVDEEKFPEIIYALADATFNDKNFFDVINNDVFHQFSLHAGGSQLFELKENIDKHFSEPTVEKIIKSLETDPWGQTVAEVLYQKSPTSLKVTLEALQQASKMEFEECIQSEYNLTAQFLQAPDFFEGIRAVVIDKDQKPHWQPPTLKQVTKTKVEEYFSESLELF